MGNLTVFPHNLTEAQWATAQYTMGLGRLTDCVSATRKKVINGDHSLTILYPCRGNNADQLQAERLISYAGQLYRVMRPRKKDNKDGKRVQAEAPHIAYDLKHYTIENIETKEDANYPDGINALQALTQVLANTPWHVGTVDVDEKLDYLEVLELDVMTVLKDQILAKWGGELVFDNWTIHLRKQCGQDRRYAVRKGKNIDDLDDLIDMDTVITRMHVRGYNGATIEDANNGLDYIDSPYINNYSHVYEGYVNFEDEDDPAALKALAEAKLPQVDVPQTTIKVNLVELKNSVQYALYKPLEAYDLGDTAVLHHEFFDVDIMLRSTELETNCLTDTNSKITLGNNSQDIAVALVAGQAAAATLKSLITATGMLRAGKLDGAIDLLQVMLQASGSYANAQVIDGKGILLQNTNTESPDYGAVYAGPGVIAFANAKKADNSWDWRIGVTPRGIMGDQVLIEGTSGVTMSVQTAVNTAQDTADDAMALIDLVPGEIDLKIRKITDSVLNLIKNSSFDLGDFSFWNNVGGFSLAYDSTTGHYVAYISNPTSGAALYSDASLAKPSTEYTFGFMGRGIMMMIIHELAADGSTIVAQNSISINDGVDKRYSKTITTNANAAFVRAVPYVDAGNWGNCQQIQIKYGNKITDWSPALDELQKIYAGITINKEGVDVQGKKFSVRDMEGSDPTFIVDTIQKMIKAYNASLNALVLNGPVTGSGHNILTKSTETAIQLYPGTGAQNIIDGQAKYRWNDVTIAFAAGNYDVPITLDGLGGRGNILLWLAPGVNIRDFRIINCFCRIVVASAGGTIAEYAQLSSNGTVRCFEVVNSFVEIARMRLTGKQRTSAANGTETGLTAWNGAIIYMHDCLVERTCGYGVYVGQSSMATLINVYGGQQGGGADTLANLGIGVVAHQGAQVTVGGPSIIGNAANLANWDAPAIAGSPTPTPSPGAYVPPTQYNVQYVHNSSKYCDLPSSSNMSTASSVWSAGAPRGGRWDTKDLRYSGMWLLQRNGGGVEDIRTLLAGKTIISATLRVHCVDCWAGTAVHDLYFMTVGSLPVGGDTPASRLVDTGIDITLTQGQDTVIDVKAFIQGRLAAGDDFYGFGLGLPGSYVKMDTTCTLDIVYQ